MSPMATKLAAVALGIIALVAGAYVPGAEQILAGVAGALFGWVLPELGKGLKKPGDVDTPNEAGNG